MYDEGLDDDGDGSSSGDGRDLWRRDGAPVYPAPAALPPQSVPSAAEQASLIAQFIEFLGVSEADARRALAASRWSLEEAMEIAFDAAGLDEEGRGD
jgi:hypothetical protein